MLKKSITDDQNTQPWLSGGTKKHNNNQKTYRHIDSCEIPKDADLFMLSVKSTETKLTVLVNETFKNIQHS